MKIKKMETVTNTEKTMMRQDTFKDDESSRNHTQPVKNTENY